MEIDIFVINLARSNARRESMRRKICALARENSAIRVLLDGKEIVRGLGEKSPLKSPSLAEGDLGGGLEIQNRHFECIRAKNLTESSLRGQIANSNKAIQYDSRESCHIERSEISKNLSESNNFLTPLHNFTPPPSPIPQGEGESLDSFGLSPTYFLEKSKQKDLKSIALANWGLEQWGVAILNPQNCNSRESKRFLPTLNSQSCDNLGDSCNSQESKTQTLYGDFKGQRPLSQTSHPQGWDSTSPSPCGRGQGGGVKNPKDSRESSKKTLDLGNSRESHESQKIFRLSSQNDKILDSRNLQILSKSNNFNDSTPPPNPLPQGEGEVKSLVLTDGNLEQGGVAPLNPQSCVECESSEISPTANSKSCVGISDLRESKNFCLLLRSKSKWGLGRSPALSKLFPSPCGRGQVGGVISQNNESLQDSHKSQNPIDSRKSNDSKRFFAYAQNDKMQDSHKSNKKTLDLSESCESHESQKIFRLSSQNDKMQDLRESSKKTLDLSDSRESPKSAFIDSSNPNILRFHFLPATDANAIKSGEIAIPHYDSSKAIRAKGKPLSFGEVACYASHYRAWEACVRLNRAIVVLEDDISFAPHFAHKLATIAKSDFSYVRLYYLFDRKVRHLSGDFYISFGRISGTQGYYLAPSAAKKFLAKSAFWTHCVDDYMDMFFIHGVQNIIFKPFIISEDSRDSAQSTILEREKIALPFGAKVAREYSRLILQVKKAWYLCAHCIEILGIFRLRSK